MKVSEKSRQKNSETVRNENDKELLKERYIYILRRKAENY